MYNPRSHSEPTKNSTERYEDGLKIVINIECGNIYKVKRLSKNHFSMEMRPDFPSVYRYPDHHSYWFYFRVEGVKEKEIKISITNCDWMPRHWKKYKPVYTYAEDPDSLTGVEWHRVDKTKLKRRTFSFVQKFCEDTAYIALRYPYTYTRLKRYMENMQGNKHVSIEELGRSAMGNPLHMIVVTNRETARDNKKGILVYAREHGVEQDGSWVIEGMIDFLLSYSTLANSLLKNTIFMMIPIISPDSAILGRVVDPTTGTCPGRELMNSKMNSIEAKLLYDKMKEFVSEGNTLDICISLHNPHGTEPNLYPNYRPHNNPTMSRKARDLHKAILKNATGYTFWKEFTLKSCSYSVGRFARDLGSLAILYEINHQAKNNFLSLERLKTMGEVFLRGIANYYGLRNTKTAQD